MKQALEQMEKDEQERQEREKERSNERGRQEPRVSTTDPQARVMRTADGGYRPAYNGQLATDAPSQIVVAVDVTRRGVDYGQLAPMQAQIEQRYGRSPSAMLVDGALPRRRTSMQPREAAVASTRLP